MLRYFSNTETEVQSYVQYPVMSKFHGSPLGTRKRIQLLLGLQ